MNFYFSSLAFLLAIVLFIASLIVKKRNPKTLYNFLFSGLANLMFYFSYCISIELIQGSTAFYITALFTTPLILMLAGGNIVWFLFAKINQEQTEAFADLIKTLDSKLNKNE